MSKCILKISAEHLEWLTLDDQGHVSQRQTFSEYAELPKTATQLVVLLPGEEFYVEQLQLPKTSRANLAKALPYLLEEKVAGSVEDLYLVTTKIPNSPKHLLVGVNRARFEAVFQCLQAYGLKPAAIVPDFFALPAIEGSWSVDCVGEKAVVRCEPYFGFSLRQTHLDVALREAKHVVYGAETVDLGLFENPVINLLQGKYRFIKKAKKKSYRRLVSVLAVTWLLILVGGKILQWGVYQHRLTQQKKAITSLLAQVMPEAASSNNPRALIEHRLRQSKQAVPDTFIRLLATVGSVLQQQQDLQLQTLQYENNFLTLKIQATKLSELEQFARTLEQHSLKIEQNAVSAGEKKVVGEMKVGLT